MARLLCLLCIVAVVSGAKDSKDTKDGDHGDHHMSKTLSNILGDDYDKLVLPGGKDGLKVQVSLFFDYTYWHQNKLTAAVYLRQTWTDSRLAKKSDDTLHIAADEIAKRIWTPNTLIISALDPKVTHCGAIHISPNGSVTWSQKVQFCAPCMSNAKVMYDSDGAVNCTVQMGSYGYPVEQLNYVWAGKPGFSNDITPVFSVSTSNEQHKNPMGTFSGITFVMQLQTELTKPVLDKWLEKP